MSFACLVSRLNGGVNDISGVWARKICQVFKAGANDFENGMSFRRRTGRRKTLFVFLDSWAGPSNRITAGQPCWRSKNSIVLSLDTTYLLVQAVRRLRTVANDYRSIRIRIVNMYYCMFYSVNKTGRVFTSVLEAFATKIILPFIFRVEDSPLILMGWSRKTYKIYVDTMLCVL